jgi:hypothetical protein
LELISVEPGACSHFLWLKFYFYFGAAHIEFYIKVDDQVTEGTAHLIIGGSILEPLGRYGTFICVVGKQFNAAALIGQLIIIFFNVNACFFTELSDSSLL